MRRLILALLLPAAPLHAACPDQVLVSCEVDGGRHLEVCIETGDPAGEDMGGGAFTYAFGPADAPELSLRAPFSAGTARPWNGVGRAIWGSVAFRNGDYSYEVWQSLDRMEPDAPLEGGVNVWRGEALKASLVCRPGPATVIAPLFAIEDAMAAAGYCWDRDRETWGREACG